ncbi:hypothetical protein EYF80_050579 [Liparis tanakae]|uniref:Uncharacterized protein n=1 Tax=Liparis tanakae TaxID=230148 RepID=A0A4Z2FEE4_9TELE|nr:hypothetical protein EYF80_050579 [Liparis tanakae]
MGLQYSHWSRFLSDWLSLCFICCSFCEVQAMRSSRCRLLTLTGKRETGQRGVESVESVVEEWVGVLVVEEEESAPAPGRFWTSVSACWAERGDERQGHDEGTKVTTERIKVTMERTKVTTRGPRSRREEQGHDGEDQGHDREDQGHDREDKGHDGEDQGHDREDKGQDGEDQGHDEGTKVTTERTKKLYLL